MQQGVDFGVVGEGGFGLVHEGDVGAQDGEEAKGVLVAEVALVFEAIEGGLGGLKKEAAEAGVGCAADFVLAVIEFADKGGDAFPFVEGGAVEFVGMDGVVSGMMDGSKDNDMASPFRETEFRLSGVTWPPTFNGSIPYLLRTLQEKKGEKPAFFLGRQMARRAFLTFAQPLKCDAPRVFCLETRIEGNSGWLRKLRSKREL